MATGEYRRPSLRQKECLSTAFQPPWGNDFLGTAPHVRGIVLFCLTQLSILSPQEFKLKTGQLLKLLADSPDGLRKDEIVIALYPHYLQSSVAQQDSLAACASKVIQRARRRYRTLGLAIEFERRSDRFVLGLLRNWLQPSSRKDCFFVAQ